MIRYSIYSIVLFLILPASVSRAEIPAFVQALENTAAALRNPAQAPNEWILAHVDVETTGLVPGYHEMIDIGVVMTDPNGKELDRLFVRIMPNHPERLSPGAAAVNAFSVDLWNKQEAVDPKEAVERLVKFHRQVANRKNVLFVAFNAWFDISFVDHLFRSVDRSWRELYHYFVLDLPSMLWSLGFNDLSGSELNRKLGIEDETNDPLNHTGLTGALSNVEVYRAILKVRDARRRGGEVSKAQGSGDRTIGFRNLECNRISKSHRRSDCQPKRLTYSCRSSSHKRLACLIRQSFDQSPILTRASLPFARISGTYIAEPIKGRA